MNYAELRTALGQADLAPDKMFTLLRGVAQHVNDKGTHGLGRDLVIRALSRIDLCGDFEKQILMSLVRSVGLYPYMSDWIDLVQDDDLIAYELHRPENMDEVFHSVQARIYHQLIAGSNVVLSASTSVGKSLLIDALIATGKYKKIVIVVPTLALIDETRKRLARRFKGLCHVVTHASQVADLQKINVYILTQERVRSRIDLSNIDLFVVDEFYKLDIRTDDDKKRAVDLNLAFHQLASTGAQFYLLGPNVQAIKGLDKYEIHFIPSEFSTVAVDIVNYDLPTQGYERRDKLVELCRGLGGPTLIYCQSPTSAVRVARALMRDVNKTPLAGTRLFADWIADNFHPEWIAASAVRNGIGLHHGGVPRSLQQYMVKLFNDGEIKFLVCTSTLIEGVNTAAENVIIYDRRRNKSVLDFFTYKNIQGRAGRMGRYFIGKVYSMEAPPQHEDLVVEYSVGEQSSETPLSLLLQLDEDDLTDLSSRRVADELRGGVLPADVIRLNSHVSAEIQNNIASEMFEDPGRTAYLFSWQGFPRSPQLKAVCGLIHRYLSPEVLRNYGISSGDQLAWHLNSFGRSKGIKGYLAAVAQGVSAGQDVSDKIDEALKIVRNIIGYRFPQDLMVLHNIQQFVCTSLGLRPGDYRVYADAVEGLFVPGLLSALEEYGLPVQVVQKMSAYLEPVFDLDGVIDRLRILDVEALQLREDLTVFEKRLIESVQDGL